MSSVRDGTRGRTPLHWVAESGNLSSVPTLVQNGTTLDARDEDGFAALQLAKSKGNEAMVRSLKDAKKVTVHKHPWSASLAVVRFRNRRRKKLDRCRSIIRSDGPRYLIREVSDTDCNSSSKQDAVKVVQRGFSDAIYRFRTDQMFANKYRIDSRFLFRKGLSRTAIDAETGQRVTLDFYKDAEDLERSLALHKRLEGSEGICELIEKIDAHDGLPDCLVVKRGKYTLYDWLQMPAISLQSKLEALDSIAKALEKLHGLGIVHGELNLDNLTFCDSGREWKLQNLDAASSAQRRRTFALTNVAYTAPELLKGQNGSSDKIECDPGADMWSFGVIAFEVLTGRKFYEREQPARESILDFIKTSRLRNALNAVQDKSHRHFIKKFLKLDPSGRCTSCEARATSLLKSVSALGTVQASAQVESNGRELQRWQKRPPLFRWFSSREPRSSATLK